MNTPTPQELLDRATEAVSTEAERERLAVDLSTQTHKLCAHVAMFMVCMGMPGMPHEAQKKLLEQLIDSARDASAAGERFDLSRKAEPERAP